MKEQKSKTVRGVAWSFAELLVTKGINFGFGIILARLLDPSDFGLVAIITIIISFSQSFVYSGLTTSLIRKQVVTDTEYSAVFYYNALLSVVFYLLIVLFSTEIGDLFKEKRLAGILLVLPVVIVIEALGSIQQTRLIKALNFKKLTLISVAASVTAGIVGVLMALSGYGYMSLVAMSVVKSSVTTVILWISGNWWPKGKIDLSELKDLLSFGSKILLSSLIYTMYLNIHQLVVGKFFSLRDLAYYNRADQFKNLPSENMSAIIQKTSLPILSDIQTDEVKLKETVQKLIRVASLVSIVVMLALAALAKPVILLVLGDKWASSVEMLQLLCFVAFLNPVHSINLNVLLVFGRSDLSLKLEIYKILLSIPVLVIGVMYGIHAMIAAMILHSFISLFINGFYTNVLLKYSIKEQLSDIIPNLAAGLFISCLMYSIEIFVNMELLTRFIIQMVVGGASCFLIYKMFNMQAINEATLLFKKTTIDSNK